MPPRTLLSSEQRTRLFAIPSDSVEMVRHYVLGAEDLALIRTKRRSINRLGFAVQLCLLRYPGLGMGPAEQPPEGMIAFVADQLAVPSAVFADYAQRDQTRREHAVELQRYLSLRSFGLADWRACLRVGADAAWATDRGEPIVQRDARPSAGEPRSASISGGPGANWVGRASPRAKEDLRDARGRAVRFGAGYAHGVARGRSRVAPLPLRLAAGLFGIARTLQHRRAAGPSRICAWAGDRPSTRRANSCRLVSPG